MKKFIFVCLFIFVGFVSSQVYAWETIRDDAWNELRELHAEYLGGPNRTSHATTEKWIAQDMNRWLRQKQTEYREKKQKLEQENESLRKPSRCDTSVKSIVDENARLKTKVAELEKSNNDLDKKLSTSTTLSKITGSILGLIVAALLGIVLIKKCQSKKLPKEIKETIAKS